MCNPSTFWLTTYWTTFCSTSLTKAICVRDGLASSNVVSICGVFPFSSNVQTPFGPLKSGIPADVLTPAPVWNTMCFESRTSFVNSAIFWSNCSGESKTYRITITKRIHYKNGSNFRIPGHFIYMCRHALRTRHNTIECCVSLFQKYNQLKIWYLR